jgi:hypothetical protein
MPQRRAELLAVVSEQWCIVSAARDSDIGHAVIEQVFRGQLGIDVDQHAVRRLPLAGMTRNRIAIIEMRMACRIELHRAASIHLQTQPPIPADTLDRSQLTVCCFQRARGAVSCTRLRWRTPALPLDRRRHPAGGVDCSSSPCRPSARRSAGYWEHRRC